MRLDLLLVARGLTPSRERARALILAGQVRVNGQPATKAGHDVRDDADVQVAVLTNPGSYVTYPVSARRLPTPTPAGPSTAS